MSNDFSLQELARGQASISQQLYKMHEEILSGHARLRHDVANLQSVVAGNRERISAHGRELGRIDKDLDEIRSDHKWLLRAIIGAYGAIVLTIIGALFGKVV